MVTAGRVFGDQVGSTAPMFLAFLAVHVLAGLTAVVTGAVAALVRKGSHSRAEITDAAMAERAECVMLNKGPHVVTAVAVLDDILRRMEAHQAKKRPMLRPLHVAERFAAGIELAG